ncbi:serine/threonine-protein kinase [Microbispora amethystogenes]|uniref:serine/threonine-protein kinase n=1 Tax=Microbispora amethystogenes TaxID=1427754 RepID=UPI0033D50765
MALAAPLLPEDPERLGGYWLAGRLGAGGQGVVYEAYDSGGRRVAVKVLHGEAARDQELRGRFGREATAARRVASFCTARVLDAQLEGDQPYIVSEYVEGPSLRRAVRQEGRRFTGDDLHRLATGVATALAAIHDAGVIHRDLKPDNVLLGPDGPRVIDFGVARTLEMSLTASGLVAGTPTYMAPEVFTGRRAGTPADVFAWGGVVVFAATGIDPFEAESLGGVMHRVLSVDPDLSMLPESLRPLVAAGLRKDPEERPAARDLLNALVSGFRGFQGDLLALGSAEAGLLGRDGDREPGLGMLAEEVYAGLGPAAQAVVPDMLLRMIAVDENGEETTRRVSRAELLEGRPAEERAAVEQVLAALAQAGLLAGADGSVTLAGPALVRAWPRLRAWADEERDGLRGHMELAAAARRWRGDGGKDADLLQGARLDSALAWAAGGRRHLALNASEREYLAAASALVRRRANQRRLLTLVLAVLLVLSVAGGGLSAYQARRIAEQRDQATGRQVASLAGTLRTTDPGTAMLLTVAGWRLAPGADTRSALTTSLYQPETAVFHDPQATGTTLRALSGDGRVLASVSADGVRLYDVRTGRRTGGWADTGIGTGQVLQSVALSPTGRYLAAVLGAKVVVWDGRTGKRRREYDPQAGDSADPENRRSILDLLLEFGDDDATLVVHEGQGLFLWNIDSGRALPHWELGHAAVASSGRLAAYAVEGGEPGVHLRRLPAGTEDARFRAACPGAPISLAFSPDGRTLACRGARSVTLVDTGTARRLPGQLAAAGPVSLDLASMPVLRYGPGGLLASFADNRIQVWRVADRHLLLDYRLDGVASDVRFDSGGRALRYLVDQSVVTVDLGQRLAGGGLPGKPYTATLSPDGRLLAVRMSETDAVRLWDVRGRRFLGQPLRGSEPGADAAGSDPPQFSRDARHLLTGDGAGAYTVWDVVTRTASRTVRAPKDRRLESAALSPDGRTLVAEMTPLLIRSASQEDERWMRLWDVHTGAVRTTVRLAQPVGPYVFSPDGRYMAPVGSGPGRFVDAASARPFGGNYDPSSQGGSAFGELAFAPDGRLMALGDGMGRIMLWSTRGPVPRPPVLHGVLEPVGAMAFAPDGRILATGGGEGTVQLWDVEAGRRLGPAVDLYGSEILSLVFSPDGTTLYAADGSGGVHDYPVDPERIAAAVCARVGRTLPERDWPTYLADVPYRDVCR